MAKEKSEDVLDDVVFLQITDQVGQLIDDYKSDLNKGFMAFPGKFKMAFSVALAPEREAGKIKVTTTMSFATEPKPKAKGQIKDKMEVIVGGKQLELPTETAGK
jgi:hypothetical protein